MTSYVKTEYPLAEAPFLWNVFQPTRSLYDFRFKSYGILCDFYKSGDLDLDLNPNLTKKLWPGVLGPEYINCKNFRKIGPVVWPVRSRTDGQTRQTDKQTVTAVPISLQKSTNRRTDKQTNRQTDRWKGTQRVHTLQNWTYRLSDLPCRLTVTKVKDTINWS